MATTIFSDDFNRPDTNTGLDDAAWTVSSGSTWGILSNQAYDTLATNQMFAVTWAGVKDHQVSIDAMYYVFDPEPTCEPYLIVSYADPTNYLYVDFSTIVGTPNQTRIQLMQVNSGTTSMMSGVTIAHPYTTTKLYNYKVITNGLSIAVYIDGVNKANFTLAGAYQKPGNYVGFGLARTAADGSYNSGSTSPAKLDNFLVETPPPVDVSTPYATKQSFTADRTVSYASTQKSFANRSSLESTKQVSTADRSSAVATSQVLTADRVFAHAMNQVLTADRVVDYALQQIISLPYVNQSYVQAMKQIVYADTAVAYSLNQTIVQISGGGGSSASVVITNTKTTDADFNTGRPSGTAVFNNEVTLAVEKKNPTPQVVPTQDAVAASFTGDITTYLAYSMNARSLINVRPSGTLTLPSGSYAGYGNVRGIDVDNTRNEYWVSYLDGSVKAFSFTVTDPHSAPVQVKSWSSGAVETSGIAYDSELDMVWVSKRGASDTSVHLYSRDGVLIKANAGTLSFIGPQTIRVYGGEFLHLYSSGQTASVARYKKNADYSLTGTTSSSIFSSGDATFSYNATGTLINDIYYNFYRYGTSPFTWEEHYYNIGNYIAAPIASYTDSMIDMYGTGTTMWEMVTSGGTKLIRAMTNFGLPTGTGITIDSGINAARFIYDGTDFYVYDFGTKVYKNGVLANFWTLPAQVPASMQDMGYDGTNIVFSQGNKLYKVSKTGVYVSTTTLPFNSIRMSLNNSQYMWVAPNPWDGNLYKLDYNTLSILYILPSTGDRSIPITIAEAAGKLVAIGSNTIGKRYFSFYLADVSKFLLSGSYRTSPVDLSVVSSATSSSINWTQALNGGTIAVSTSLDNGVSWQAVTSGGSISGASGNLVGKSVLVKADFTTPIITSTPKLLDVTVSVTHSGVIYTETTTTDFQAGTLTNTVATANQLQLSTTTGPVVASAGALIGNTATANTQMTNGLAYSGTALWAYSANQQCTYSIDPANGAILTTTSETSSRATIVTWNGTGGFVGSLTTGIGQPNDMTWNAVDNTVCFQSGDGSADWIAFFSPTTLKITGRKQFLNSAAISNTKGIAFDGTYYWMAKTSASKLYKVSAAGNNLVASATYTVTGFTWDSLAWDGTYLYGLNAVAKTVSKINTSTGVVIETVALNNVSNATVYHIAANSTSKFVTALTTGGTTTDVYPLTYGPSSAFNATGSRISPAFDLSAVGSVVGSTINWTGTTPANTTLTVDTSINNGSTWSPATKGAAITGLNGATASAVMTRVNMTSNGSATSSLQDITVSVGGALSATQVSIAYNTKQAMVADQSTTESLSQVVTADRSSTASLAQTITADRATLESMKLVLTADRITLESMQQMIMASIDVSVLYAMNQAMYADVSPSYATAQALTADRSSAEAMKQSIFSTSATNYLSTQRMVADRSSAEATNQVVSADRTTAYASRQVIYSTPTTAYLSTQRWYVGHTVTNASQQFIYANQTLPVSLSQIIHADRTVNYPTSQMSHTTRTGEHALRQSYYVGISSTHALAQILFALRLDDFTLNQFIPMDRVWAYTLSVKILDPEDKRITVVDLVAILEEMDIVLIATKDTGDVALFAQKDTDVNMAVRMAVKEAPLS
jgi:hypothetical protein